MSIAQNMSNQNFGHGDLESRKINQHTSKVLKTPLRKNGKQASSKHWYCHKFIQKIGCKVWLKQRVDVMNGASDRLKIS